MEKKSVFSPKIRKVTQFLPYLLILLNWTLTHGEFGQKSIIEYDHNNHRMDYLHG